MLFSITISVGKAVKMFNHNLSIMFSGGSCCWRKSSRSFWRRSTARNRCLQGISSWCTSCPCKISTTLFNHLAYQSSDILKCNCRLEGLLSMALQQTENVEWDESSKCSRMSLSSLWPFLAAPVLRILPGAMWQLQNLISHVRCYNFLLEASKQYSAERWMRTTANCYSCLSYCNSTLLNCDHNVNVCDCVSDSTFMPKLNSHWENK